MQETGKNGKDQGQQEDKGNNKSAIRRTAGNSNNYQRQTHICKSLQLKLQTNTGAVILCHEDIMRE